MSPYYNAVFFSLRPITWLRIWGEIVVPAAFAAGSIANFNLVSFLLGFLVLGPIGWSALYILNDITDRKVDQLHPQRKNRAIASGKLSVPTALFIVMVLLSISLGISLYLGGKFTFVFLMIVMNQLMYTLPPMRLKEIAILDITNNGINSILRFLGGWYTQASSVTGLPIVVLLFLLCIKLALFLGHRGQSAQHEKDRQFKSTAALLSQKSLGKIIVGLLTFSGVFYILSFTRGFFPTIALGAIVACLPFIPAFFGQLKSGAMETEKDEGFRTKLYCCFFLFMTVTSLCILYGA